MKACGSSTTSRPATQGEVRASRRPGLARPRPARVRPLQQRRLGLVRLAGRPGDDQPPRRRRLHPEVSTPEKDYLKDGFYAKTAAEEVKCPDLELNVLDGIEDVTDAGQRGRQAGHDRRREPRRRRRPSRPRSRRSATRRPGCAATRHALPGRPVPPLPLQEVHRRPPRLRPGAAIAFFGGDPDNFEYPRFDLDVASSASTRTTSRSSREHYLKWSADGPKEDELVFVSGHPGRPTAEHGRRAGVPARHRLPAAARLPQAPRSAAARVRRQSAENARRPREALFGVQNSRKARIGGLAGLLDPKRHGRKKADEEKCARRRRSPTIRSSQATPAPGTRSPRRRRPTRQRYQRVHRPRARALGFNAAAVRHRPHARPRPPRRTQAQRRAAARVPRVRA